MKKTVLTLVAVAALFASCKKDYTCACKISRTVVPIANPSDIDVAEENYNYSSDTKYTKVKKKTVQDKFECYSTESTSVDEFYTGIDPTTFEPQYEKANVTYSSTCEITK